MSIEYANEDTISGHLELDDSIDFWGVFSFSHYKVTVVINLLSICLEPAVEPVDFEPNFMSTPRKGKRSILSPS